MRIYFHSSHANVLCHVAGHHLLVLCNQLDPPLHRDHPSALLRHRPVDYAIIGIRYGLCPTSLIARVLIPSLCTPCSAHDRVFYIHVATGSAIPRMLW